ncbi:dihydroxyacetone kinase subunit DhaL [Oscillospiraceae bacterium PP1C4]
MMAVAMTSKDYVDYIRKISARFEVLGDYITALDAATGDGDHWSNINTGFLKLVDIADELSQMSISDMLKKIGMTLMSAVGGSSGVLYGSAYLAAAKATMQEQTITLPVLANLLEAMQTAIMQRGNAQPNQKTMLDALYPAVQALKQALAEGKPEIDALQAMKLAATDGAAATKSMEAVRGRACYQANKGVGHLDPGAVTMSYQLETLADSILTLI